MSGRNDIKVRLKKARMAVKNAREDRVDDWDMDSPIKIPTNKHVEHIFTELEIEADSALRFRDEASELRNKMNELQHRTFGAGKQRDQAVNDLDECKRDFAVKRQKMEHDLLLQKQLNEDLTDELTKEKTKNRDLQHDLVKRERDLQGRRMNLMRDLEEKLAGERSQRWEAEEALQKFTKKKQKEVKKLLKQRMRLLKEVQAIYRIALESELGQGKADGMLREMLHEFDLASTRLDS